MQDLVKDLDRNQLTFLFLEFLQYEEDSFSDDSWQDGNMSQFLKENDYPNSYLYMCRLFNEVSKELCIELLTHVFPNESEENVKELFGLPGEVDLQEYVEFMGWKANDYEDAPYVANLTNLLGEPSTPTFEETDEEELIELPTENGSLFIYT